MEFQDVIAARHSVRSYTSEPVSGETLQQLLQIAVQAPTGMNLQPWAFGVIQGAETIRAYSDRTKQYLVENIAQFPMLERYRDFFANPDANLFHGAPAVIAVYAKPAAATPDIDCTMAAYNIMLAATDMGLGTCWIGFFGIMLNQPEMKQTLGVPDEYRAVAAIAIGHPAQSMSPVEKAEPQVIFWQE